MTRPTRFVPVLLSALLLATALVGAGSQSAAGAASQSAAAQAAAGVDAGIGALLRELERTIQEGNAAAYGELVAATADRDRALAFAGVEVRARATRVVIKERDRQPHPDGTYRLVLDAFIEYRNRARIATWRLDLRQAGEDGWRITDQERLSAVDNLHRLTVNRERQYAARNFTVRAEDLELTLASGTVFTIETDQGPTGLILLGRGEMRFSPTPQTEKGQVRIFAGRDALESRFDAAYVRFNRFEAHADRSQLVERPIEPRDLRRAEVVFQEESPKTYMLELEDLSREGWFLLPGDGDFLAEVQTRRWAGLTYARASSEPEDISVFDRRRQRHIAVYASAEKLASRGRFYDEDDYAPYDVLDYAIDVRYTPDRLWIEGLARMRLRVRAGALAQISLRLAESLAVRSIVSDEYGRLFNLRIKGQNNVLVSLPATLLQDTVLSLVVTYGGPLAPLGPNREAISPQPPGPRREDPFGQRESFEERLPVGEPHFLYSNSSHWYPQPPVSDYATATIRISVPASFHCVASGTPAPESPTVDGEAVRPRQRHYVFIATRPVRYLAFLVSRFTRVERTTITFGAEPGRGGERALAESSDSALDFAIEANPLQLREGRALFPRAVDVLRFYRSLVGEAPYESLTLALVENVLPGGHSPAYLAALHQPLPNTPLVWRSDPASFPEYPEFFLAHELAHQWWGQAVGWRNYHEQWLSEGFAQYFAALYAEHHRGDRVLAAFLRQLRRWSLDRSDQGPIYLGYRLGHVKNDGRVFRALVYNKGAAVLHMLRRLIGDEPFWRGLRRFYADARFQKVGTDDLRLAMEREANRPLERFFERWVYGATLPQLTLTYDVEPAADGAELILRVEQHGELFDVPVVVTLEYSDGRTTEVLIAVTEQAAERRVPLDGELRSVDVDEGHGILARVKIAS